MNVSKSVFRRRTPCPCTSFPNMGSRIPGFPTPFLFSISFPRRDLSKNHNGCVICQGDEPSHCQFLLLDSLKLVLHQLPHLLHQRGCRFFRQSHSLASASGMAIFLSLALGDTPLTPAASPHTSRFSDHVWAASRYS